MRAKSVLEFEHFKSEAVHSVSCSEINFTMIGTRELELSETIRSNNKITCTLKKIFVEYEKYH